MSTSEKQIAANRRNAIKHGLHACDIVLKSPHLNEGSTQTFPEKVKISETNPIDRGPSTALGVTEFPQPAAAGWDTHVMPIRVEV